MFHRPGRPRTSLVVGATLAFLISLFVTIVGSAGVASAATPPVRHASDASSTMAVEGAVGGSVDAGGSHTCGVQTDGTVACWGLNNSHQATPPAGTFTQVSAGGGHTCGVKTDSTVACWGKNDNGQTNAPSGTFTQVSAGFLHTCGVKTDGGVACWGRNDEGQAPPISPSGTFTQVSAGGFHTCGVQTDGTVACWGGNGNGQSSPPAATFTEVSAGDTHTCGVKTDGTVACWGENIHGELNAPSGTFTEVSAGGGYTCGVKTDGTVACWGSNTNGQATPPSETFTQVSAGSTHTCGVKTDGTAACWGNNGFGQADAPSGSFSNTAVDAGGNHGDHTCGVKTDGTVACWGYDAFGQTNAPSETFTQVSAGGDHTCGVQTDGTVACWGYNGFGETTAPSGTFTQVSAGGFHTCGVNSDGTVACWGDKSQGASTPPAGTFTQVSAGAYHTCGVQSDGTVACWGGDDAFGQATPPSGTFTQVSAGFSHTCGVKTDGTVACWGYNAQGQTNAPSGTFTQVSAGDAHTCAVKTDGTVACWGSNGSGQTTPPSGTFTQVSAGFSHTCGVKTDGTVACWGSDGEGELGAAPTISNAPPDGTVGAAYDFTFTDGASPAATYEVTSGSLPDGLSLSSSGEVTGTPTTIGTSNFDVTASNLLGSDTESTSIEVVAADSTPPVITDTLAPTSPGSGGWYNTPVTLTWSVSDPESSFTTVGCTDTTVSAEQAMTDYSCSATSEGGTSGPVTVSLGYDTHAPTFTPSLPAGSTFAIGQPAPAVTLAGLVDPDPDGAGPIVPSGIASSSCGTIDTSTVGAKTVSCTATDNAGNTTMHAVPYYVTHGFAGYLSPLPKSTQKKGSTIPVKFMLANYAGTTKYPNVANIRVRITGPGTAPPVACPYIASIAAYQCNLKLPATAGNYVLTAQELFGTDWVALANTAPVTGKPNANGEPIKLK